MRIFGFEITRSNPLLSVDGVVWNVSERGPVQLGDLTADELRRQLATVHNLARTRRYYYIRALDDKQQLHVNSLDDLVRYKIAEFIELTGEQKCTD